MVSITRVTLFFVMSVGVTPWVISTFVGVRGPALYVIWAVGALYYTYIRDPKNVFTPTKDRRETLIEAVGAPLWAPYLLVSAIVGTLRDIRGIKTSRLMVYTIATLAAAALVVWSTGIRHPLLASGVFGFWITCAVAALKKHKEILSHTDNPPWSGVVAGALAPLFVAILLRDD